MNIKGRRYLIFMLLAISSSLYKMCCATDTINSFELVRYMSDDTVISSGGSFELGFFSPKNSTKRYVGIWYKKISVRTVVWVANRDNPLTDRSGALRVTQPRFLLLLNATNATIWSTNTSSTAHSSTPVARLLDSGNLVVKDANDENPENFLWQSFDYPTDTFLPGMKLGKNLVSGQEVYITSWKNSNDPASGDFTHHFDSDGYPQSNIKKGPVLQYKTGPWNGLGFSGLPILKKNLSYDRQLEKKKERVNSSK